MGHFDTATRIAVPADTVIRLFPAANMVVVAPVGVTADPSVLTRPGVVGGFTHDRDVAWPNASGCAAATEYLRCGHPIVLVFEAAADADACHERMLLEAGL